MTGVKRFQHPCFARFYPRIADFAERQGASEHRERLLAGLVGRVIEVGAGHGLTFAHYPSTVTEVLAVEPDATLRARAEQATRAARVPIAVRAGHAEDLPAGDGSMDAAVLSLVLCTVPDQARALASIARVLRPGGELRFYEHVRSGGALAGRAQDLITPVWSLAAGGCHPNRDTETAIRAAGFVIDHLEQVPFGFPHIIGRAHLPPLRGFSRSS